MYVNIHVCTKNGTLPGLFRRLIVDQSLKAKRIHVCIHVCMYVQRKWSFTRPFSKIDCLPVAKSKAFPSRVQARSFTCMYVCMYICMYVFEYVCSCVQARSFTCMYVYMYV